MVVSGDRSRHMYWMPLTGGDPCPGTPSSYSVAIAYWETRAADVRGQAEKLGTITSVDAQSQRVRRVEQVAAEGQAALENMAEVFDAAKELLVGWKLDLEKMQQRADEALGRARWAQSTIDDIADKASLGQFAVAPSALTGIDLEDTEAAQRVVAEAQGVVDEIRGEYARLSAEVIEAYQLNVEGLWSVGVPGGVRGNFGSSVEDVTDTLLGYLSKEEAAALEEAALKASQGPVEYQAFLDMLAELDPGALVEFFRSRRDLSRFPLVGTGDTVWDAAVVKAWWDGLGFDRQYALVSSAPGLVGNLNGVPYRVRDEANRVLLDELLADEAIKGETRKALEELKSAAEFKEGEEDPRFILVLDISLTRPEYQDNDHNNDVLAAVSVGDVDAADATTVQVPGMDTNVQRSVSNMVASAQETYDLQEATLNKSGQDIAVVAYLGYDTPNLGNTTDMIPRHESFWDALSGQPNFKLGTDPHQSVLSPALATRGGYRLARFYDGLNVTKSQNQEIPVHGAGSTDAYNDPYISLNAHSYGTTMSAEGLSVSQTAVDNAVFYGSAGLNGEAVEKANAGQWRLERDASGQQQLSYVHSGEDWLAPVGSAASFRKSPGDIEFAQEFSGGALVDSEGKYLEDVDHHPVDANKDQQGYWSSDTAAAAQGVERSLKGVMNPEDERSYIEPYYTVVVEDPVYTESVGSLEKKTYEVRVPVTADDIDPKTRRIREDIFQKMLDTQNLEIVDGKVRPKGQG